MLLFGGSKSKIQPFSKGLKEARRLEWRIFCIQLLGISGDNRCYYFAGCNIASIQTPRRLPQPVL